MYTLVPYRRAISNSFPSLFGDRFMREFFGESDAPAMRVDIRDKDDAYLLEADLPGVKKDDISISVNDGMLTISADVNGEKKEEKNGYVCSERRCGHMERSFNVEGIDVSGVTADYKDGVLMVHLPKEKVEAKTPMKIAINETKE